jgi:hypothetical protein
MALAAAATAAGSDDKLPWVLSSLTLHAAAPHYKIATNDPLPFVPVSSLIESARSAVPVGL